MEEAVVDVAAASAFLGGLVQVPDRVAYDSAQGVVVFAELTQVQAFPGVGGDQGAGHQRAAQGQGQHDVVGLDVVVLRAQAQYLQVRVEPGLRLEQHPQGRLDRISPRQRATPPCRLDVWAKYVLPVCR
ncbi:hypothetical protein ABT218_35215 [Streptomyces sp. NPDC001455]|uniref:hypothetical protein n=1 Tax=Streptomyces sp. NPDC001455 TaxID=3154518 RepID=UPI0033203007